MKRGTPPHTRYGTAELNDAWMEIRTWSWQGDGKGEAGGWEEKWLQLGNFYQLNRLLFKIFIYIYIFKPILSVQFERILVCIYINLQLGVYLCVSHSVISLQPHELWPTRPLCPWTSPGKNTGVGWHSLLLGIFLTQGSNPGILHWRRILYIWIMRESSTAWCIKVAQHQKSGDLNSHLNLSPGTCSN